MPRNEYPRPQFRRESFLCLNGKWDFAIGKEELREEGYDKTIVVPFAPETELSGLSRRIEKGEHLHYQKEFVLPKGFAKERTYLHFEAVDQIADVYFNGKKVAHHEGGYLPFSAEVTDCLEEKNVIRVDVYDDVDSDVYPKGKQNNNPRGIWYTPTSGIWGSVWMESVPNTHIERIVLTPNLDEKTLNLEIVCKDCDDLADVSICFNGKEIRLEKVATNTKVDIPIDPVRPWSPEDPALYDLKIKLGEDEVSSYFAMRKFSSIEYRGKKVLALNNKPYFLHGVLDQGYWPESGLTPPSEEALVFDVKAMKDLGFNMLRKHIKIEPMPFYYHCDRLGMVVMQDILNAGKYYSEFLIHTCPFIRWPINDTKSYKLLARGNKESRDYFEKELPLYVEHLYNVPSIGVWTLFNEGWGQFDSVRLSKKFREYDSSRLLDSTSGWFDRGAGDFCSRHIYFRLPKAKNDGKRILSLSEFGGFVLPIEGHGSGTGKGIFYTSCKGKEDYEAKMRESYLDVLQPMIEKEGLSVAVFTQLSDVEEEQNGLYTYDRAICKVDKGVCLEIAEKMRFPND
ncbi:MAG: glycoside hydrolase family 2 [Bacilli bacterium]|nr:glycoside hydrolase family 2 [Bacilli bacterium]